MRLKRNFECDSVHNPDKCNAIRQIEIYTHLSHRHFNVRCLLIHQIAQKKTWRNYWFLITDCDGKLAKVILFATTSLYNRIFSGKIGGKEFSQECYTEELKAKASVRKWRMGNQTTTVINREKLFPLLVSKVYHQMTLVKILDDYKEKTLPNMNHLSFWKAT